MAEKETVIKIKPESKMVNIDIEKHDTFVVREKGSDKFLSARNGVIYLTNNKNDYPHKYSSKEDAIKDIKLILDRDANDFDILEEDIEKHDTLNPVLWNEDGTLKPEVKEKIDEIVKDFLDGLAEDGIKINVKDVKLVGSNCSYNYTKDSDLDIHIVADTKSLECPDNLYPIL